MLAVALPQLVAYGSLLALAIIHQHRAFHYVLLYFLAAYLFGQLGLLLLSPRFQFDSQTGMMTTRRFFLSRRRPLADIVAVQVVSVGPFNAPGGTSPKGWQVNLVLDDQRQPRLFVWCYKGRENVLANSRQLAQFLGVRFLGAEPKAD